MLGNPKYKRGNKVLFKCADKEKVGYIEIVYEWGTIFFDKSDVCYDIMVDLNGEQWLFKHLPEKEVIGIIE